MGTDRSAVSVSIQVDAWDRVGLVRDVSTVIAEKKVNILSMTVTEHNDRTTTIILTVETKGLAHLSRTGQNRWGGSAEYESCRG